MPHALGTIDRKHICIRQPDNYKKFFSILMFTMVDANLAFRYVEVREPGQSTDVTVFNGSTFLQAFNNKHLIIPKDGILEGDMITTLFFF